MDCSILDEQDRRMRIRAEQEENLKRKIQQERDLLEKMSAPPLTEQEEFFMSDPKDRERKPIDPRRGNWLQVYSGLDFYPLAPKSEDIRIEDIAHSLSLQCRFNGHCRTFYSVAEHSVRVSEILPPELQLAGLLHDASEAYFGDMVRPLKIHWDMRWYVDRDRELQNLINQRFGLELCSVSKEKIRWADETLLATEARDLMGNDALERWDSLKVEPLAVPIEPWDHTWAKMRFLAVFSQLTAPSDRK